MLDSPAGWPQNGQPCAHALVSRRIRTTTEYQWSWGFSSITVVGSSGVKKCWRNGPPVACSAGHFPNVFAFDFLVSGTDTFTVVTRRTISATTLSLFEPNWLLWSRRGGSDKVKGDEGTTRKHTRALLRTEAARAPAPSCGPTPQTRRCPPSTKRERGEAR